MKFDQYLLKGGSTTVSNCISGPTYRLLSLDIQGHLLRFDVWTPPKPTLKNTEPGGMTGCLGYLIQVLLVLTPKNSKQKQGDKLGCE